MGSSDAKKSGVPGVDGQDLQGDLENFGFRGRPQIDDLIVPNGSGRTGRSPAQNALESLWRIGGCWSHFRGHVFFGASGFRFAADAFAYDGRRRHIRPEFFLEDLLRDRGPGHVMITIIWRYHVLSPVY